MAKNKKKIALKAITLGGLVASQVGLFAGPASAAAVTVTNCNDSGAGSLRQALEDNNSAGGATISFDLSCDTITALSPLYIERNVSIFGPGADELTVKSDDANAQATFIINDDGETNLDLSSVEFSGLTIVSARDVVDGVSTSAIRVGPNWLSNLMSLDELDLTVTDSKLIGIGNAGLGINALLTGQSVVTVDNTEFTIGDAAEYPGQNNAYGMEVYGAAEVNITDSYMHDLNGTALNAIGANGVPSNVSIENSNFDGVGRIFVQTEGNLDITNSYIASQSEGSISLEAPGTVTLTNSTLIGNVFSEGTMISAGYEIRLFSDTIVVKDIPSLSAFMYAGIITMAGTIIASETGDDFNCMYMGGNDLGGNLATNSGCVVNDSGASASGDSSVVSWADLDLGEPGRNTTNPTNSGNIFSIPIGEESVARDYYTYDQLDTLNRGDYVAVNADVRGVSRPANGKNDVGAYEYAQDEVLCAATQKLGTVNFDAFSSTLNKKAKMKLRNIAQEIVASGCSSIILKGYTSTNVWGSNSKSTAKTLAASRTKAVKKFLSKLLEDSQVTVSFERKAIGNSKPVATNNTFAGRAKNRRVEIIVTPTVG